MTLTDAQFTTDVPYSHGSIRNHMVHLANVDGGWLRGLKEDPAARSYRLNPEDYTTREQVRALCDQAEKDIRDYVAALDDDALGQTPKTVPTTVWQTLLHLVNHGTDHRGQVLRVLHDLKADTFDQDLIYYYLSKKANS